MKIGEKLQSKVQAFLTEYDLLRDGETVILGLSGGADSVALFHLLLSASAKRGFIIHAVHVNHGIRGEEAKKDQLFVRELCTKQKISLFEATVDVPMVAKNMGISEEEAGRRVRYEIFTEEAKKHGTNLIATAHHLNDQAETVLFRMFRGTSLHGLGAMQPVSEWDEGKVRIIRPLLDISKEDLVSYLRENNIAWCEDGTNADNEYARNRIRNRILPEAQKINSAAVQNLAQTAKRARAAWEFLHEQAQRSYAEVKRTPWREEGWRLDSEEFLKRRCFLSADELKSLPEVLRSELFVIAYEEASGNINSLRMQHLDELGEVLAGTKEAANLPGGYEARCSYGLLVVEPAAKEQTEEILLDESDWPFAMSVVGREQAEEFLKSNHYTNWLDYDKMVGTIVVRTPKAGDCITLEEQGKTKPINRFFIDKKLDRSLREHVLLLADDEKVLAIPGVRTSASCYVTDDTKRILLIEMKDERHGDKY